MDSRAALDILQAGLRKHQANDLAGAEAEYRRVLADNPNHADALHLLGVLAGQCGHPQHAENLIRRAIAIDPLAAEFHQHLGSVLMNQRRIADALACFASALRLAPDNPTLRAEIGGGLIAAGRVAEGVEQLRIAAERAPDDGAILADYGFGLSRLGRTEDALRILHRAIEKAPDHFAPWMQLGEALWRDRRYDEALPAARRAVSLAPALPQALVLLGNTLQTLAQFEEAADVYRRAQQIDPGNFDAHSNHALTILKMGRAGEALALYDSILQRWPGSTDARANRSLAILTLGDLKRGWDEYEARWSGILQPEANLAGRPRWDGADPAGRTILLTTEQGLGDVIHFVRYAPLIAARNARVLVACAPELAPIVRTVRGVSDVVTSAEAAPPFDLHAPVASLPRIFGTTLDTIPATVPYLTADPQRVDAFRTRLIGDANVKIGLVWAGTARHLNDRARSCALADFAPLAQVAAAGGVTYYSLQKGPPAAQALNPPPGMNLVHLGDDLHDFADTAELLMNLDLLISVDTSIVHLAGALARPAWVLLAKGPDWRWLLDRDDSPWYPTLRLFRQPRSGDWHSVLERVAAELPRFIHDRKETTT